MSLVVKKLTIFRRGIIHSLDIRVSNLHETGLVIFSIQNNFRREWHSKGLVVVYHLEGRENLGSVIIKSAYLPPAPPIRLCNIYAPPPPALIGGLLAVIFLEFPPVYSVGDDCFPPPPFPVKDQVIPKSFSSHPTPQTMNNDLFVIQLIWWNSLSATHLLLPPTLDTSTNLSWPGVFQSW